MKRTGLSVFSLLWLVACAGAPGPEAPATPVTVPLPVAGLAGREVAVLPVGLLAAEDAEPWSESLRDRAAARARADSLIGDALRIRAPEVTWILPERLRVIAARNPAMGVDPDRMPTALLRGEKVTDVPDPLQAQLRTLVGLAGGRYALVPASLLYDRAPDGSGRARLTMVLADVRRAKVTFRTVATGDGPDPWSALDRALRALTPLDQ